MQKVGVGIKKINHYTYYQDSIRGRFSSVHPDSAAGDITKVEVGEEGLHFI